MRKSVERHPDDVDEAPGGRGVHTFGPKRLGDGLGVAVPYRVRDGDDRIPGRRCHVDRSVETLKSRIFRRKQGVCLRRMGPDGADRIAGRRSDSTTKVVSSDRSAYDRQRT